MIGEFVNCTLKGQEKNLGTWAICKLNMIVHNFQGSDIRKGDTLGSPKHVTNGELDTQNHQKIATIPTTKSR